MTPARSAAVVTLLGALLAGCAGSTGASPSPTTSATTRPSTTPPAAVTATPAPVVAAAGSLVDRDLPLTQRTASAEVSFGGLAVGKVAQGRRQVLYPTIEVQYDDAGRVVAHLKLPVFTCPTYGDLRRLARTACQGRTVAYADADERSATLTRGKGGSFVLDVVAAAYRYGPGVDRSSALHPVATGETVQLRVRVRPGSLVGSTRTTTTFRVRASVMRPGVPGVATEDNGYVNRLVRRGS